MLENCIHWFTDVSFTALPVDTRQNMMHPSASVLDVHVQHVNLYLLHVLCLIPTFSQEMYSSAL